MSLLLFETFLSQITLEIQRVISTIYLHMNRKVHMACNFNYLFENEELLKVTASHVHCICGYILDTVLDILVINAGR